MSAEDRAWNLIDSRNKVCKAILVPFQSIREGYPACNTAGHTRKQNVEWQERLDIALTNIGRLVPKREIINDDDYPLELVHDDSSVESDSGYSINGSAGTRCPYDEDIQIR